jgi:hypothetical protein
MTKTVIPADIRSERGTKSGSEKPFDINAVRKPLKMTATLKRRALKKRPSSTPLEGFPGD